jgi:hypothetical protein
VQTEAKTDKKAEKAEKALGQPRGKCHRRKRLLGNPLEIWSKNEQSVEKGNIFTEDTKSR